MDKKIVFFNIIYYIIIVVLIKQGRDDPSSSLGYGYFMAIFMGITLLVLVVLLVRKVIRPKSLLDKIGVFTLTPILSIAAFVFISEMKENSISEWYFNKNKYRYKVITFDNDKFSGGKRMEYYKSIDTLNSANALEGDLWVKDSTWVYLSRAGDTVKKVRYKNGVELK